MCVPDVVKTLNVKIFNLMSRTKKTHGMHETCKCKCTLHTSICNNNQRWIAEKRRCEWKELIDKDVCDKGSISNPSNCECECDKSCGLGEYLEYEKCKCRKKVSVYKLIEHSSAEECT